MEKETQSTPAAVKPVSNMLGGAAPIFCVESVAASIPYYLKALGFKLNWNTGNFASVSRDRCCIFLCEDAQGRPGAWAWVGVTDAGSLAVELREAGANIRHSPTNYPWAYEMQVQDLDGNILRFGSDTRKGEPFGDFLDMHGRLWPTHGTGTDECD